MARSSPGNPSLGDILRSVAVLGGVLAVGAIAVNLGTNTETRLPEPVDYTAVVDTAREEYAYEVLAPASLPQGWRATSVDLSQEPGGDRWRLGVHTDDGQYVGLHQSDGEIEAYRAERLAGFVPDGTSTVDGATWERLIERDDDEPDRALALAADGAVTIVIGTVDYRTLGLHLDAAVSPVTARRCRPRCG